MVKATNHDSTSVPIVSLLSPITPQEQATRLLELWQLMRELEPRERVQKLELAEYADILDAVAREMADAA
jgi:hypothetical protein